MRHSIFVRRIINFPIVNYEPVREMSGQAMVWLHSTSADLCSITLPSKMGIMPNDAHSS